MPVDRPALDEAVRRFPAMLRECRLCTNAGVPIERLVAPERVYAIRSEYRRVLTELAKQRRKAA